MLQTNINEEYLRAMHMGQKEKKRLETAGKDPYPAVLNEQHPETSMLSTVELPVQDIPADRIIGTKTKGRISAFSASFLPLPDIDSEFAMKWMALCEAHLSDTGIRDPIECYEYLGDFYVQEGNKRASVLKYFGAVRIPARVFRILPSDMADPRVVAYYEFVDFHKATGIYDVQFKKPGEYAKLYSEIGKKQNDVWSDDEKHRFASCYHLFKQAFTELGGREKELLPEEALLLFLKVYPYEQLCEMTQTELKSALSTLWGDVQASSEPSAITVKTVPNEEEKKGVISKLISGGPKHLNVAFIYQQDEEKSLWTKGHAKGASHLASTLSDSVKVINYYHADSPDEAQELLDNAVSDGADLVFTTTPLLLGPTLKAAVKYQKVKFFNCSACQPLSSVRSYYCRTYEGKFITGLIAGALADNNLVGYIGSYPILGVPASINAFALGVRMTNPRAKIYLEWSSLPGDPVRTLQDRGVRVISNRDVPVPRVRYLERGYGTFYINTKNEFIPIASPCWVWGKLYEKIVRTILAGNLEKKDLSEAVNYWWGMDSGVIDVTVSNLVPNGVKYLADTLMNDLRTGTFDPFKIKMTAQDGSLISDGENPLSSLEILQMDRLSDAVEGRIPKYDELLPMSRALVRELGAHLVDIPAETED